MNLLSRKLSHLLASVLFISFFCAPLSCGKYNDNAFAPLQKKTSKDKGKSALSSGDYDTAIRELEKYCGQNPSDMQCKAMLANAYMKKSSIDELQMAAKITEAQKNSGGNDFKALLGAMPAGTAENVAGLQKAVDALSGIPAGERTPEQNYQLAIASASLAVTIAKKSGTDSNGNISSEKVDQMSDDEANAMVKSLSTTKEALTASSGETSGGASKLGSLSDKIAAQPGATDAEKLRAYLKTTAPQTTQ